MRLARRIVMALVVGASCMGLIEGAIRGAGVVSGEALPSPLGFQALPRMIRNDGSTDASFMYMAGRHREVLDDPTGLRVIVFGGSAVHGERYSPFHAFVGQLDRHLNRAFDTPVEVLNLGSTGIGVRHVRALVRMVVDVDRPDLVIVYSGNNEFHEIRVLKTLADDFDSRLWVLRHSLFRLHLYRLLARTFRPDSTTPYADVLNRTEPRPNIAQLEMTADASDRKLVEASYRDNLSGIADLVQGAGIPLLFSTVATNLRLCPDHDPDELADPDSSAALCTAGEGFAHAKQFDEARPLLERAEHLSRRPFRSNVVQREIVRSVAREADAGLCDIARTMSKWSPGGILGWDVFDDSCHPNSAGHTRIGAILAQCVLEQELLGSGGKPEVWAYPLQLGGPAPVGNVFRLDRWSGSRHPHAVGVIPPRDDSPEATAVAGHEAFVADQFAQALTYYALATERGGPAADLQVSSALTRLYMKDIDGARRLLDLALPQLDANEYLHDFRATLGP